ncbi:hypothetical protein PYCCODRAFT_1236556 [Trametes coccinea BRFM310]|uniref:Uncharacterized protein n=1 Tax=Trametes coccinea (strain BRFM310) TaxID=1353009 RepID=A0A1Y2IW96_TRAC3|nr:hypothetical protein PYCCODRAFT_1236556 [Trametes coccinea BRFM310]
MTRRGTRFSSHTHSPSLASSLDLPWPPPSVPHSSRPLRPVPPPRQRKLYPRQRACRGISIPPRPLPPMAISLGAHSLLNRRGAGLGQRLPPGAQSLVSFLSVFACCLNVLSAAFNAAVLCVHRRWHLYPPMRKRIFVACGYFCTMRAILDSELFLQRLHLRNNSRI